MEMTIPDRRWPELEIFSGRTEEIEFEVYDKNGEPEDLEAGDTVRFKMADAEDADEPAIDAKSSGSPPADATHVIIDELGDSANDVPARGRVIIAQDDTAELEPGDYYGEILLVDDSETNPADAIKPICRGRIRLTGSQAGDVDL